jgi:hypothetical protein
MTRKSSKILFFALILTAPTSIAVPIVPAQAGPPRFLVKPAMEHAGAIGKAAVEGTKAIIWKPKGIEGPRVPRGENDGEHWTPEHWRDIADGVREFLSRYQERNKDTDDEKSRR